MQDLNPYVPPVATNVEPRQARFRLRRWFAAVLYLAFLFDFYTVWAFGFHPFLSSLTLFMLGLIASIPLRRSATVELHGIAIHYQDLVQSVDFTSDRIVRVIHGRFKTEIKTSSPLTQITLIRKHHRHAWIVERLAALQTEFGFEISDAQK
ncbi:MAG: hypothetical protein ACR2NZ_24885 [Rubripirellula sp.]